MLEIYRGLLATEESNIFVHDVKFIDNETSNVYDYGRLIVIT